MKVYCGVNVENKLYSLLHSNYVNEDGLIVTNRPDVAAKLGDVVLEILINENNSNLTFTPLYSYHPVCPKNDEDEPFEIFLPPFFKLIKVEKYFY